MDEKPSTAERDEAVGQRMLMVDEYRRFEECPGGPSRPAWMWINDGTRQTGASVTVSHADATFAAHVADTIAAILPDATGAIARAQYRAERAEERERRAHAARLDAEARLDAVLHGRRTLFGEALVRVTESGDAWLLDPHKQEAGFGLCYPSLVDLWRAHPELRPVRWESGDLIVDATIAIV